MKSLNMELLKDKKKRNLLVNSESIKGYKTLYQFLLENEEINDKIIESKLSDHDKITVNDMFPNIIKLCQDEWKEEDDNLLIPYEILEGENRKKCSLCGQNNKEIYYITNKFNGKKLNVGKICVKEFALNSFKDKKTRSQWNKEAKRNLRLQEINSIYNGIEKIVTNWDEELKKFELLIPSFFEKPYLKLGADIRKCFNDYLDKVIDKSVFEKIGMFLDQRSELINQMQMYCDENKDKDFVVNRKIVEWLRNNNDQQTIELLKNTGYVTVDTVHKINETEFLLEITKKMKSHLSSINMSIRGIDEDRESFIIKPSLFSDEKILCKYEVFLNNFGWVLFGEKPKNKPSFIRKNIIIVSRVYDRKTCELILLELGRLLAYSTSKISIYFDEENENRYDYDYDFYENNQLDLWDKRKNKIVVVRLSDFLKEFKLYALEVQDKDEVEKRLLKFVDFLPRETHWYTKEEIRDIRTTKLNKKVK
ncbi:hypothetical protein B7C51_24990 (plasmid) [Paenibacillus larvae subsp. pulvifaciens]|uniref:Uncharacterized protein n=1 Tax=Paenibacillus larvae subsp. pulvifaciens TaxID=1477 RepID=A0A1V0V056_9BACL|nr:hypothetical protein [Paenibacillus larvae]ARF70731.1 hypothetical protein B7C51_24990 [Paenibacillus larvae subsp. pulvifaciens]